MNRLKFRLVSVLLAALAALLGLASAGLSSGKDFAEIANTRTPRGVASQELNNTPKAVAAPTPPMGWNSWDNFGLDITEAEFKAQVDYAAAHLKAFGYVYMVIDAGWYAPHLSARKEAADYEAKLTRYPTEVDGYGRWIPAPNKFPSASDGGFRALADYVHGRGLKFGLHIQRGIPWTAIEKNLPIKGTGYRARDIANPADGCSWWDATLGVDMSKPGAQEYYDSCYALYASWGVDFVKVDDMSKPYHADEITAVRIAIEKSGRAMVYSLSPGSTPIEARYHARNNADMWRISEDFWDTWPQLKAQFELAARWMRFGGGGHWPDLDMLPVGIVGTRSGDKGGSRRSRLTPEELRTMMTLWCLFRSPLILGGDLTRLNAFETGLVAQRELLDIDQRGGPCRRVSADSEHEVYLSGQPGAGRKYLAFFNLSDRPWKADYPLAEAGLTGRYKLREVWSGRELGIRQGRLGVAAAPHGPALYALEPAD